MVADKGKKSKLAEGADGDSDNIDEKLVLSIEKLQEIQDELEKVRNFITKRKTKEEIVIFGHQQ